jgi:hypothetical protein
MPDLLNLPAFTDDGDVRVVIETPRRSRAKLHDVSDLPKPIQDELEKFFVATDELEDKKLKIVGWKGPKAANKAIKQAGESFARENGNRSNEPKDMRCAANRCRTCSIRSGFIELCRQHGVGDVDLEVGVTRASYAMTSWSVPPAHRA